MAGLDAFFRPVPLFSAAALLRVAMLYYGQWQDANSAVKYTDIDYLVFTDAARFTAQGRSPYDRETYRYTPLLAWILVPTAWQGWFAFGKVIFAVADLLAGFLIVRILERRGVAVGRALKFASIWLLNPMVATISTRGSSEGLLGVLVMALLWAVLGRRTTLAGLLLGFGVHFKIYPFIYAPAIVWWMDEEMLGRKGAGSVQGQTIGEAMVKFVNAERVKLAVISLATFMGLNIAMFSIYGTPFLVQTYFHHVTRIDHRHNFSPYNVLLYLTSAFPSTATIRIESVAFLPQILLSTMLIPFGLAKKDLATSMMAQTFAFVTFNKYFLWYMVFLPIYLPGSTFLKSPKLGATALALWITSQAAWLQQGFNLEFLGISTFFPGLFASSIGFFLVNCWILGIMATQPALKLRAQPLRPSPRIQDHQVAMWLLETDGSVFGGASQFTPLLVKEAADAIDVQGDDFGYGRANDISSAGRIQNQHLSRRSTIVIEDLGTKTGTTVDGHKYKGEKHVVAAASAEIKMGGCPDMFRLTWQPVVLTFSFSSREMQSDPFSRLRVDLEQLDVKLLADYNTQHTTHVVTKKRNTSKGLQALINGRYIVADSFVDAIVAAATPPEDDDITASSVLETDFDGNWPDPLKHLPPRGGEPVERPPAAYAPDEVRLEIFEGYTFIFYDRGQFDNLLAPITNGKGKALYTKVDPKSTTVDDFVLYVKTEAGEKGLGSFEVGSEGRGVVVVRFVPNKGDAMDWYADFFTQVSLRLDHRPIEQNEFLEAILIKDASILRRPLEMEPTQGPASTAPQQDLAGVEPTSMDVDQSTTSQNTPQESSSAPKPAAVRSRVRRAPTRRFAGFDDDDDEEVAFTPPVTESKSVDAEAEEEGLFVSQDAHASNEVAESLPDTNRRSQRKRPAAQDDDIEDIIPTAAAVKRRRIAAGEEPIPRNQSPEPPKAVASKVKKVKKEIDVLDVARRQREEMEARAKAEKEDLANLPDDVDLEEIRRLHIVEEMPLRQSSANRGQDKDAENDRWDPRWNGRKNFKRFKPRGELTGRPPQKVIVSLTQVKTKEFGIGDDYWLEDDSQRKKKGNESQKSGMLQDEPATPPPPSASRPASRPQRIVLSDDSEDDEAMPDTQAEPEPEPEPTPALRSRSTRATTATQSQNTSQSQSTRQTRGKRAAPAPAKEPPAKKPRATRTVIEVADSDDSEDELQFKFGRRR
ncbi:FHA domain-containing protein [Colletotrichum orchidophilum]|uniref:GPI mannosyltransferase 1 n=1 Tax=Colletotrichum orchidophilum TaxID=1209926 RepID=A0A1G4BF15_9PEZI|nr:FHA domain-containing protein [Colletotrichum orchidophilum]OHE99892.1 FHA domain-containing protein [Colletotrichum orchidophilum]